MVSCVLVVDLKNFVCNGIAERRTSQIPTLTKTFIGLKKHRNTIKATLRAPPKSPHKDKVTETTKITADVTSPTIVIQKTEHFVTTTSTDLEKNTASDSENVITTTNSSAVKTGTAEQQPSILIYMIPAVIVMSVVTVVVYIFVKQHHHRCSHPVETQKSNNCATPNEVLYADLSLAHGDFKPPRHDQASPYAQIIGVMRPVDVDANIQKK